MNYNILKNISDDDCKILGLNPEVSRPEEMILKTFPVPPTAVRPSAKADFLASSAMEDDLTHKLADIIKANMMPFIPPIRVSLVIIFIALLVDSSLTAMARTATVKV